MHLNRIAERTWQTRITSKLWYNLFNTNKTDQKLFSPSITLLVKDPIDIEKEIEKRKHPSENYIYSWVKNKYFNEEIIKLYQGKSRNIFFRIAHTDNSNTVCKQAFRRRLKSAVNPFVPFLTEEKQFYFLYYPTMYFATQEDINLEMKLLMFMTNSKHFIGSKPMKIIKERSRIPNNKNLNEVFFKRNHLLSPKFSSDRKTWMNYLRSQSIEHLENMNISCAFYIFNNSPDIHKICNDIKILDAEMQNSYSKLRIALYQIGEPSTIYLQKSKNAAKREAKHLGLSNSILNLIEVYSRHETDFNKFFTYIELLAEIASEIQQSYSSQSLIQTYNSELGIEISPITKYKSQSQPIFSQCLQQ